ncbi:hypothetical protein [Anditalea andensis]|uniref:Uncharacterized protein n=1 Tax=Anditalea andensis TaxID=1048983 RepID=A0A074L251_9BACT|nr:hypothetical protein [Anditalea andensis]KEO74550.1 hypothetical protein EL17_02425 [Anditalea andensis]
MNKLSENWFSEGLIDFEYKKYLLLAYLQDVKKQFDQVKLYPSLADLMVQHKKMADFQAEHAHLRMSFPKKIKGISKNATSLDYEPLIRKSQLMQELESIVDYALPHLLKKIDEGKSIYDFIEDNLEIEPIGIRPIYQHEGYAFLSYKNESDIYIYRYKVRLFENSLDAFRGVRLNFVKTVKSTLFDTETKIKMDLSKNYIDLPNPAVWRIHSRHHVPLEESLVPISKRLLLKYVA